MDIQTILLSALSIIVTALVTWLSERLISWINAKVKNTKYAKRNSPLPSELSRDKRHSDSL